jgi:hypothetical protein
VTASTSRVTVPISWGDGEYLFNVARIGVALELEEKCGAGLSEIMQRLLTDRWKINDVRETLRLGLIGGGTKPEDAKKLLRRYFEDTPIGEHVPVARVILMAAILGVPGDPVGKPKTEGTETEDTSASSAPISSDLEPLSAGSPETSTTPPSGSSPQP